MYIVGDRYKCAICDDTDFCANCEASPANNHNATHPLIKFKTSVRHVNITTSVDHKNGRTMPMMGDRPRMPPNPPTTAREGFRQEAMRALFEASASAPVAETKAEKSRQTSIQTVVDVKPSAPVAETMAGKPQVKPENGFDFPISEKIPQELVKPEIKLEAKALSPVPLEKATQQQDLVATFVRDTVPDSTVFGSDHVFEQTWVLRNDGTIAWPAGCSVKYVGGDYMGHLDANRPAATHDLESSSESTVSYVPVAPGEEHSFTVLLRTPQRTGRVVSNWRLTTKDGLKFGHRLWCDVLVRNTKAPVSAEPEQVRSESDLSPQADTAKASIPVEEEHAELQKSQMIFPKLEKESPEASIHNGDATDVSPTGEEEYEDLAEDSWVEDDSFLTDEEYDILDASDEESQHTPQ